MTSFRYVALPLVVFAGVWSFVGCGEGGIFAGPSDELPSEGSESNPALPPPSDTPDKPPAADAGTIPKPPKDGGTTSGPAPTPDPGVTCAKVNEVFSRKCGACGTSAAICLVNPEGGAGIVSLYSACGSEVGACVPGTLVTEPCGNCGTRTKTCSNSCAWTVPACTGEPPNSCPPDAVAWLTAGCASATAVTTRTCGSTCQWSNFTGICADVEYAVTAPAVGKVANVVVPLRASRTSKRLYGDCATEWAFLSSGSTFPVTYVRVINPSSKKAARATVWNVRPTGAPLVATVLTTYASIPSSDKEITNCIKGAGDYCDLSELPCGDTSLGTLSGDNQVWLAPGASVFVAITADSPIGLAGASSVSIQLSVRTDAFE